MTLIEHKSKVPAILGSYPRCSPRSGTRSKLPWLAGPTSWLPNVLRAGKSLGPRKLPKFASNAMQMQTLSFLENTVLQNIGLARVPILRRVGRLS